MDIAQKKEATLGSL